MDVWGGGGREEGRVDNYIDGHLHCRIFPSPSWSITSKFRICHDKATNLIGLLLDPAVCLQTSKHPCKGQHRGDGNR